VTRPAAFVLALLLGGGATLGAQAPRIVATLQLPPTHTLTGVLPTDLDGDAHPDLVLAVRTDATTEARTGRELRFHRGRALAEHGTLYANEPSRPPLPIDRDVIAFTCVDCRPSPGRELVLLTQARAVLVAFAENGEPRYEALAEHRLVWPAAARDFVLPLAEARCDFDRDGRDDLLLPTPDGALLQSLAEPARRFEFSLPPRQNPLTKGKNGGASFEDGRFALSLSSGDGQDRRPLVQLRARTPRARLLDLDGDGTLELTASRNGACFVGRPMAQGTASERRALPLPQDRLSLFDPAFSVQWGDVDGDRRLDLLLSSSARRDDEVEVRIDLFRTGPDGSWAQKPDSRLRVQPLARPPQLVDADGDGRLDVVVTTVRTDALRMPGENAPKSLEAQLTVFRGDGTRFRQPAALAERLQLPAGGGRGTLLRLLPGAAGQPGRVLLCVDDALVLRPLLRDGERLRLGEATGALPLPAKARFAAHGASSRPGDDDGDDEDADDERPDDDEGDLLVRTAHELLVVRLP
jgi:hypothetical protein